MARLSATIRGGRRLARFFAEAGTATQAAFVETLAEVIRSYVLPQLKAEMPRKTGRLRNSLRVVVNKGQVQIRGEFYGRFQRLGPSRTPAPERVVQLIQESLPTIRAVFRSKLKQKFGV